MFSVTWKIKYNPLVFFYSPSSINNIDKLTLLYEFWTNFPKFRVAINKGHFATTKMTLF